MLPLMLTWYYIDSNTVTYRTRCIPGGLRTCAHECITCWFLFLPFSLQVPHDLPKTELRVRRTRTKYVRR